MIVIGTVEGLRTPDGETLVDGEIVHAARDSDALWVLTPDRILRGGHGALETVGLLGDVEANCLLPSTHGLLVGGADARLYRLEASALRRVESFDAIGERDTWYTPWGGPPDVRSMTQAPDGTIYVGVHVGGILRSRDGGATWQQTIDIDTDIHQVVASGDRVIATGWDALHISSDGGQTWAEHRDGFDDTYMRAAAVTGEVLLVTAAHSHAGKNAGVYRRPLRSDGPFVRVEPAHPSEANIDTHWLAASGNEAVFVTLEGTVYRSLDHGLGWAKVAEGLVSPRCVAFV